MMKHKKTITGFVIAFFLISIVAPAGMYPRTAKAAGMVVSDPTQTGVYVKTEIKKTVKETTKEVKSTVLQRIWKGLVLSASISIRNALVQLARTSAEQTVKGISTGDWGGAPMFYTTAWDKFVKDTKDYAAGRILTDLRGEAWDLLGLDICNPGPNIKLKIVLGQDWKLQQDAQRAKPDCTYDSVVGNWTNFYKKVKEKYKQFESNWDKDPSAASLAVLQEATEVSFGQKGTDVGIYLSVDDTLKRNQAQAVADKEKQRQENLGAKSVTTIGGNIKTPSFLTRGYFTSEVTEMKKAQQNEITAAENVMESIPESIAAAFLTTFLSKGFTELMTKKLFEKGLVQPTPSSSQTQTALGSQPGLGEVQRVSFAYSTNQIDLLTEFTSCPTPRQINNCVMDGNFATAVRRASQDEPLTVQEAISQGYLNGSLPLIGPEDGRNSTNNCYQQGWCYSNLVKLRQARIIPIGWEMAAQQIQGLESKTLKTAMSLFNDSASEFYHLIDPNWVLKYPKTQCNALVSGPLLSGAGADARGEVCVDMPSCLKSNDAGDCQAWGYCAAEKNVFRLGGQDCNGAFDSCRTFTTRDNQTVNYVYNTTDATGCDSTNVGCQWYAQTKVKTADLPAQAGVWNWQDAVASKIYLNKNIENQECQPDQEGCSRFIRTQPGMGTNLLVNGDFEYYGEAAVLNDGTEDSFSGWDKLSTTDKLEAISDTTYSRATALKLTAATGIQSTVRIVPKDFPRYFVVSAYVTLPQNSTLACDKCWELSAGWLSDSGQFQKITGRADILSASDYQWGQELTSGTWQRKYLIVEKSATDASHKNLAIQIKPSSVAAGSTILVDAAQVEELDAPYLSSAHTFNSYASQNAIYLKKAPEYLKCYNTQGATAVDGQPATAAEIKTDDDAASTATQKGCDKFAKLCTAQDVGCEQYTPTDNGQPVNGVTSYWDYCPQECAGYSTFSQSRTYFENAVFPLYFIPSSAKVCPASELGCDEFTNLDVLTAGGEAKEYYKELRQCARLPEEASVCQHFYTWVGSGVSGYKLQDYYLRDKYTSGNTGGPDGVPDGAISEADMAVQCNATIFAAQTNPDCRQFYNDAGQASYRLYSKTISCSENCHPYRRTLQYQSITGGQTAPQQCEARAGRWDTATSECIFMAVPNEGRKCSATNAGCREYKGNFSGDETIIYQNDFSSGSISGLTDGQVVLRADGRYLDLQSSKKVYTDPAVVLAPGPGRYVASFWAKRDVAASGATVTLWSGSESIGTQVLPGLEWKFYSADFTIASAINGWQLALEFSDNNNVYLDNFKIIKSSDVKYLVKDSWVTPATCNQTLINNEDLNLAQLGCRAYKDRTGSTNYLKSFSSLCSSAKVGCEALIDTQNNLTPYAKDYLKLVSFEDLCQWPGPLLLDDQRMVNGTARMENGVCKVKPTASGTEDSYNYQNLCQNSILSRAAQYEWRDSKCYQIVKAVSDDSLLYLVNDPDIGCASPEKGCTALGQPNLTVNTSGAEVPKTGDKGWNNVFYKLDPDQFEQANSPLCSRAEKGCDEFKDTDGVTHYFRDPGDKLCEYRKVVADNQIVYGWYKKGSNGTEACTASSYYNDEMKQLVRSSSDSYTGWVGQCDDKSNLCTAFVDPTDRSLSVLGKPYYYLNNDNIDKTCTAVSRKEGCVLFNDTSQVDQTTGLASLTYNAYQTYINSEASSRAVAPVPQDSEGYQSLKIVSGVKLPADYEEVLIVGGGNDLKGIPQPASQWPAINCGDYTHCSTMEQCLVQGQSFAVCFTNIHNETAAAKFDANTRVSGVQLACLNKTSLYKSVDISQSNTTDMNKKKAIYKAWDESEKNARCTAANLLVKDSNTIVKVVRDRECADWYACRSSHWSWDTKQNKYVEVCDNIGLCGALTQEPDQPGCAKFVTKENKTANLLTVNEPIKDNYASRLTGWYGLDFAGLVIPAKAPVQFYNAVNIKQGVVLEKYCNGDASLLPCAGDTNCASGQVCLPDKSPNKDYRLVRLSDTSCRSVNDCATYCGVESKRCNGATGGLCPSSVAIGEICPSNGTCVVDKDYCRCLGGVCVKPEVDTFEDSAASQCRAYPREDAPFPYSVANSSDYENANISYLPKEDRKEDKLKIQKGDYGCYYQKVTYGGGAITKYMPWTADYNVNAPGGFCMDDPEVDCGCETLEGENGQSITIKTKSMCSNESKCGQGGSCMLQDTKVTDYSGWQGYCLEQDKSLIINNDKDQHPCLSWYPTQALAGLQDLQNNYEDAGYNPDQGQGSLFAVQVAGNNSLGGSRSATGLDRWETACLRARARIVQPKDTEASSNYQRNIANLWIGPGAFESTCAQGHSSSVELFLPDLALYDSSAAINENQIAGIAIRCGDSSADWCRNGSGQAANEAWRWYAKSTGNGGFATVYNEATGFVIPKGVSQDKNGFFAKADQALGTNNQLFKGWKYWQVFWEHGDDLSVDLTGSLFKVGGFLDGVTDINAYKESPFSHCSPAPFNKYFGIRILFDAKGDYRGLWTSICDAGNVEGSKVDIKIDFLMHEYATTLVKVNQSVGNVNKAKTQTIYEYEQEPPANPNNTSLISGANTNNVAYSSNLKFGAAKGYAIGTDIITPRYIPSVYGAGVADSVAEPGGSPWTKVSSDYQQDQYGGKPWGCVGGKTMQCDNYFSYETNNGKEAYSALNKLFVKVYDVWKWSDSARQYGPFANYMADYSYPLQSGHSAPIVAAREALNQTDAQGNTMYSAVPGKFTISTTAGSTTNEDIIGRNGQLDVNVQFYAWAHDQQMPLTRVLVNWGDGLPVTGDVEGKYKNHKPRCQQTSHELLGRCKLGSVITPGYACAKDADCAGLSTATVTATCDLTAQYKKDWFGDTPDACTEAYFSYQHVYTCEDPQASLSECSATVLTNCYEKNYDGVAGQLACRFKVGVQALDNWDWCNGSCPGEPAGDMCYDGFTNNSINPVGNRKNECSDLLLTGKNPWQNYDGYIYIVP